MNSQILKIVLLMSVILQAGCEITFKRKSSNTESAQSGMISDKNQPIKEQSSNSSSEKKSLSKNFKIISLYYSNPVNATVRKDMITHTSISKKQENKLVVGKIIDRDIQVMPLPLELERILSPLPLHVIRVQVGMRIILMNVKTRRILEIIKI